MPAPSLISSRPLNFYGQPAVRVMRDPSKWIGKRVSGLYWSIPQGYVFCAMTGKLHREEDAYISCYIRFAFDKQFLIANGIYVEEADWLSEEGYDLIVSKLEKLGLYEQYKSAENRFA